MVPDRTQRGSSLLHFYLKSSIGVGLAFLALWGLATLMNPLGEMYVGGEHLSYWEYYLWPLLWYSTMFYAAGTAWLMTEEIATVEGNGRLKFFLQSRRVNRSALVALPFFGLGIIFSKGGDAVEHAIALISLVMAVLIILRMILRDIVLRLL